MNPGIYSGIPFKDYLAIDAVSNSYLGRLDECPAAVRIRREDTPSLALGRAVHALVLEGVEEFSRRYFKLPEIDARTKNGKAEIAVCLLENEGREPLTTETYRQVIAIREAVMAHPWASILLRENIIEQTVIWNDRDTGLLCKGRPDAIPGKDKATLTDLKTTRSAGEKAFTRSVIDYGYARQAAFYIDGYGSATQVYVDSFALIAVETTEPFRVEVYALSDEFLGWGREQYQRLLKLEAECRRTGVYPNYTQTGIVELEKPGWLV